MSDSSAVGVDVSVRDVGPRDGLQGETPLTPEVRAALANGLARAGVRDVEVAAFVSPKAVPAMADAAAVVAALDPAPETTWWALVPNRRGGELAIEAGITHLTVTVSASPAYSDKNVGMTVDESVAQVAAIRELDPDVVVDVVVSCAFGSPFDDVTPASVAAVAAAVLDAGGDRLTLADTTGTATPRRLAEVLDRTGHDVGLHLHDTRATALTNAYAALDLGVRRFDTAVGGLGGSPFAPGAGGNLATEDLVLLFDDLGVQTGIELDGLLGLGPDLTAWVGHELPSRVLAAGPLPPFAS